MSSDRLGVKIVLSVNGREYLNADDNGKIISFEVEHRDQQTSRMTATVQDYDLDSDIPFPEYNAIPNPRCNPNIPVMLWAGWDEGPLVKMFEGVLTGKEAGYQLSQTTFESMHEAFKLKRKGKVDALQNLTIGQMLKKKAAEEGIVINFDRSVSGDPALNTPVARIFQGYGNVRTNWQLMLHFIRELGWVVVSIRKNELLLTKDKLSGQLIELSRGDDWIKSLRSRQEQRQDDRAATRKGHAHEPKPGQFSHHKAGQDCGVSRNVRAVPPSISKTAQRHKAPLSRFSVKNKADRFKTEGDEIDIDIRLRPEMKNLERVSLAGFGAQINGVYQTLSVTHRGGDSPATTSIQAWKP